MNQFANKARTETLPDQDIIAKILTGEKQAFELLIRKYNARLYRVGMSIVNDPAEVEDIMQTAYIKAYEHLSAFENRAAFGTWLTRILINESLLQIKKKQRFMRMEDQEKREAAANAGTSAAGRNPMYILINKELGQALENALEQLPEKYRLVFVLREMEGMNIADTVNILGITEVNVKVRLNRAKTMLRDALGHYYKSDRLYEFHLSRCDKMVHDVLSRLGIR